MGPRGGPTVAAGRNYTGCADLSRSTLYGSGGRCPFVVGGAVVAAMRSRCPRVHGGSQVDGATAEISDLIMAVAGVLQSGCGGRRDLDHFYRWGRGGKREAP